MSIISLFENTRTPTTTSSSADIQDYLLACVRQANQLISLKLGNFEFAAFGQHFLSELEYASVRGVDVIVVLDPVGAANFINAHSNMLDSLESSFQLTALDIDVCDFEFDSLVRVRLSADDGDFWRHGHGQAAKDIRVWKIDPVSRNPGIPTP